MKEIKFRAWLDNEMLYQRDSNEYMYFTINDSGICVESYVDGIDSNGSVSCKIMQYTGRKDKNGTEVYEGDIVKIEHWSALKIMTYIERRMGFYPVDIKNGMVFDLDVGDDLYEVIGNIYENPELLEKIGGR